MRFPDRQQAHIVARHAAALAATAVAVAACTSAPPSEPAEANLPALNGAPASEPIHQWLNYDRPAQFDQVSSQVRVPMRDGATLACNLFQPSHDGQVDHAKHPSILIDFNPYSKEWDNSRYPYLAQRGYNVMNCDVRGSGNSDGEYPSWFQPQEATDNYDAIEWLAAQPNSTGDVGQVGDSYGSITAYRVAALRPPHLRTIIPIVSPTNIYSDWVYPGGAPSVNGAWWSNADVILSTQGHTNVLKSFQDHPLFDDYWKQVVTTNKLSDVTVPALQIGGYNDIFKNGGFDALRQRPDQTWLLYGPWIHVGLLMVPGSDPAPAMIDPANALSYSVVLQWFDHWLGHFPDAKLPPNRVVSYESNSAPHTGRWIGFDHWPASATAPRRLYPVADGTLSDTAPRVSDSQYTVSPYDGPSADVMGSLPTDDSQNQAAAERNAVQPNGRYATRRSTFTLPPFDKDLTVAGPVTLHVMASIDSSDTTFVSKLEAVLPDGRVMPIETGYLRAQLRNSQEKAEPVPPGQPTAYLISLGETHWRFKAGESLRVTLGGGDHPRIVTTTPAGVVTIHHGPDTYVDLPIVD